MSANIAQTNYNFHWKILNPTYVNLTESKMIDHDRQEVEVGEHRPEIYRLIERACRLIMVLHWRVSISSVCCRRMFWRYLKACASTIVVWENLHKAVALTRYPV